MLLSNTSDKKFRGRRGSFEVLFRGDNREMFSQVREIKRPNVRSDFQQMADACDGNFHSLTSQTEPETQRAHRHMPLPFSYWSALSWVRSCCERDTAPLGVQQHHPALPTAISSEPIVTSVCLSGKLQRWNIHPHTLRGWMLCLGAQESQLRSH